MKLFLTQRKRGIYIMELIVINENKLKITLSECDMKQYSLDCNTIDYDNTETRRAFWNILDEVKHQTGFDAASQKVFIQLYPSKEGGCEMYVTKLGLAHDGDGKDADTTSSHRLHPLHRRRAAYSFDSVGKLTAVCKRLSEIGFSDKSSAWHSLLERGRYYLILEEPEENAYLPLSECSFIFEYGKSENLKNTLLLLHEHASCICEEGAVDTLAGL